jgi:hypothetical protein
MFTTAVKTTVVEALVAGFSALNPGYNPNLTNQFNYPINNGLDLTPNSITIEYPLEQVQWPCIMVQFRPNKVQWSGLNPDTYYTSTSGITISGVTYSGMNVSRSGYFEGNIDLQIMATHSEERDRLYDSVTNLILMGQGSPANTAFTQNINNNTLVGITMMLASLTNLGDSVTAGTPWSPEELTYEASIRIPCIGDFYESKYDYPVPIITKVTYSGTAIPNYFTTSGVQNV